MGLAGTFTLNTQEMVVSDPCYVIDTWCQGILKPMLKGKYNAYIDTVDAGKWGIRVARLKIAHEDVNQSIDCGELAEFEVGVDSGQAGFWDIVAYRNPQLSGDEEVKTTEDWYDLCCTATLSDKDGGVQPFGVVSRTGYGDGIYRCYFARNAQGLIVAAEIEFIDDFDNEWDGEC